MFLFLVHIKIKSMFLSHIKPMFLGHIKIKSMFLGLTKPMFLGYIKVKPMSLGYIKLCFWATFFFERESNGKHLNIQQNMLKKDITKDMSVYNIYCYFPSVVVGPGGSVNQVVGLPNNTPTCNQTDRESTIRDIE